MRVAVLAIAVVAAQQLLMGPAVTGLSVALVLALFTWLERPPRDGWRPERTLAVFAVGIAIQGAHFLEEWATGFATEFPALLGYEWSGRRFVAFNLAWMLGFGAAALGVLRRVPEALLVVWFFAFVAIANGVLHVAVAAWRAAYFPGVVTAPALLAVGTVLLARLSEITSARAGASLPSRRGS